MNTRHPGYLLLVAALLSGSALAFMVAESMKARPALPWASSLAGSALAQAGPALPKRSGP